MNTQPDVLESLGLIIGADEADRMVLRYVAEAVAELIAAAAFVRDNAASDSPEMWARLDSALAGCGVKP